MKAAIIGLVIALLALGAGLIIVINKRNATAEELAQSTAKQEAAAQAEKAAQEKAEALARQLAEEEARVKAAEEAARMAEAKSAQQEAERQARIQAMNAQLAKEEAARVQAEKQAAQVEAQMKQLEADLAATRKQQEEIAQRQAALSGSTDSGKHDDILADIEQREQELASLKAENTKLKQEREVIIERQVTLEEQIMHEGGSVDIPGYRVWSPNYRPATKKQKQ